MLPTATASSPAWYTTMTEFARLEPRYTAAPMSLCSAMSQGYVGYDLQNAIRTELLDRGLFRTVSTVITQVKVSPFDRAFSEPSKVIGRVMNAREAAEEEKRAIMLSNRTAATAESSLLLRRWTSMKLTPSAS